LGPFLALWISGIWRKKNEEYAEKTLGLGDALRLLCILWHWKPRWVLGNPRRKWHACSE